MKKYIMILMALFILPTAFAGKYAVVVNSANADTNAKEAYLLNTDVWSSGETVMPYALDKTGGLQNVIIQKNFSKKILEMSMGDYNNHWSNRKAGGKTTMPTLVKDFKAMKRFVERKSGAIGFVPIGDVTAKMKKIGEF